MDIRERAKKLKTDIPAVFLALKAAETPLIAKVFACMTIIYALSPVDLIPDFIPVLGYLDDLVVLPALTALTIRLIPVLTSGKLDDVRERIREEIGTGGGDFLAPVTAEANF